MRGIDNTQGGKGNPVPFLSSLSSILRPSHTNIRGFITVKMAQTRSKRQKTAPRKPRVPEKALPVTLLSGFLVSDVHDWSP
jgi:hypothetical protein